MRVHAIIITNTDDADNKPTVVIGHGKQSARLAACRRDWSYEPGIDKEYERMEAELKGDEPDVDAAFRHLRRHLAGWYDVYEKAVEVVG